MLISQTKDTSVPHAQNRLRKHNAIEQMHSNLYNHMNYEMSHARNQKGSTFQKIALLLENPEKLAEYDTDCIN